MRTDIETGPEALAFTIRGFCKLHAISERFYFKLKADGRGPDEIQLGHRVLISREAAARWRAEREAKSTELTGHHREIGGHQGQVIPPKHESQ
jgi:hypothetical protein